MKIIETLFNRIYYSIYSLLFFINRVVLGKVFEIAICRPLYSIPCVRRRLEKNGLDYNSWIDASDSALDDPQFGLLNWVQGFLFAYILTSPFFLAIVILVKFFGLDFHNFGAQNFGMAVFVIIASTFYLYNRFVLKDSRYLEYYKKFEKEGKQSVIIWSISVLIYGIASAIALICSI